MAWYKGNIHCHSTNSDGDALPTEVARFYSSVGMDFVTISDHNRLTPVSEYAGGLDSGRIAIPCCEYTGAKSCHVVAVDVGEAVAPAENQEEWTAVRILQDGIDRTRRAGGVPVLCHPCWNWAFGSKEILELEGATHFEVLNAAPDCNSYPVAGRSAPEEIWDEVLSAGRRIFGVADDDAHVYRGRPGEYATRLPRPGIGWCSVKVGKSVADELPSAIRQAFEAGHFYATNGIDLEKYRVGDGEIFLAVKPWADKRVVTEFIGRDGVVLDRRRGLEATYALRGDEGYVRARIVDSTGCITFTQPVFLDSVEQAVDWTSAE